MISGSGNSKGVNRHVWFDSITSSGKNYNRHCIVWLPIRENMVKILIGCKYCVRNSNNLLVDQQVLQMSQILRLCVIESIGY